jgi:DNA repair photolyase
MKITHGTESIVNPLQKSALNKKGLCDYVVNVASGCLHGCSFCYVPSTPVIRANQAKFQRQGVLDPQMDWGEYLFVRDELPTKLEAVLDKKRTWEVTPSGKGVVMLCSGTDPYQNSHTAKVTRRAVEILLAHDRRVRVLTRGLSWTKDLDLLVNQNVTLGASLPHLDDALSRQIEPNAPLPSSRYQALKKGYKAGCRLYIALAPTPPVLKVHDFKEHLKKVLELEPEVIFWEPINARGTNGKRMLAAGLNFANSIMGRDSWASYFISQWEMLMNAAQDLGCLDLMHVWVDQELEGYVDSSILNYWLYKPTPENWGEEKASMAVLSSSYLWPSSSREQLSILE